MENQEPKNPFACIHTPFALVALALSVLFFSQIKSLGSATKTAEWQRDNVDKQISDYEKAKDQLIKGIDGRKAATAESSGLQLRFGKLLKKVKLLSEGDKDDPAVKDAKAIIEILVRSGITSINIPDDPADAKKDSK